MCDGHPDVPAGSTNIHQVWEVPDPEKWVAHGYICVRVDSRGGGRSPGFLEPFSPREQRDFYNCIEWAGVQPWSNGKIGLNGISYYAVTQWEVASLQPPHLAAICVWEGAADWYRDGSHHGGILSQMLGRAYDNQIVSVQYGVGERGRRSRATGEFVSGDETLPEEELARNRADWGGDMRWHNLDDEWFAERMPDWSKVQVPLLSAGNWGGHGLHLRGNIEGFLRSASKQKWLELHGEEHWVHFYTDYGVDIQRRFFDHFLKGEDNGWENQPPIMANIRHADGTFTPRVEHEWPLARTEWMTLYLTPDLELANEPPSGKAVYSYEGMGDGLVFRHTFERETEILGPAAAKLFLSSQTDDADVFLVVRLFDRDGKEVTFIGAVEPRSPLGHGWLRASHRKLDEKLSLPYRPYHTHDEIQPLTPGEVYELDVEILPLGIVIPAGYTLALNVQGRDFEHGDLVEKTGWMLTKGSGPFLHDDPDDRPSERFGRTVSLHFSPDRAPYMLLAVIP
jgi:predicted acyl esterase